MDIITRVLIGQIVLFIVDMLLCGFVFGFIGFLALNLALALATWGYSRLRPTERVKWQLQSFGGRLYWMEAA